MSVHVTLQGKRDFTDGIKVTEMKVRRLCKVGPMLSHGTLKVEEEVRDIKQKKRQERIEG